MKPTVVVTGDAAGNTIIPSKDNAEYGYIRVEQKRVIIDERGWARKKTVSALIPGTIADLKEIGWAAGEFIEGKVQILESLTPFNKKDPERDYKIAGKTGIVCCLDGNPIYRKTLYNPNPDAKDETIQHNNTEAIKAKYKELEAAASEEDLEKA